MFIAGDRWTCPLCERTVVVGESEDVALELFARRLVHEESHRLAAILRADAERIRKRLDESK